MNLRKFVLLGIFLGIWVITPHSSNAVIVSTWGDVVTVKYTLSVDGSPYPGNIDQVLDPIYLSTGSTTPSMIEDQFPGVAATYLLGFKQGIIGLQVNEEKSFVIDAADAYTDPSHALYGKDLYYDIELLEILYDAVVKEVSMTTTSATTSSQPLPPDYSGMLLLGGGVVIIAGGFVAWGLRSSQMERSALSKGRTSTSVREETIQKNKQQIKELRELTESITGADKTIEQTEQKFRRRRR
ncbi:MAG: FKBP-type peptidyl-prolyl cis-trans isomerase [Candidatus Hodarchaeales archaeon]